MPERKPCRCLLAEFAPDMAESVRQVVELLPPEQKASAPEYARRLALCRECPQLRDGTCALCGCYVEARAAKKHMKCPDIPSRWGPDPGDLS